MEQNTVDAIESPNVSNNCVDKLSKCSFVDVMSLCSAE